MTRRTVELTTPSHRQAPFAEFAAPSNMVFGNEPLKGMWRIWQHFNKDATAGTYLELWPCGRVERVTIGPDGNIASTVTVLQEM